MRILYYIVLCALFIATTQQALAQRAIDIKIDESFVVETHDFEAKVSGKSYFPLISLHKILLFNNTTYVCLAVLEATGLNPEFIKRSRVEASDGEIVKRWFKDFTRPRARFVRIGLKNNQTGRETSMRMFALQPGLALDQIVKCHRVRKKWRQNYSDGWSKLIIPDEIWIEK